MVAGTFRKGSKLGKYLLVSRLGRGSFADVWKARDTIEHRLVALKIVYPQIERDYGRNGIEREARIAARLSHPNIVAIRNADWIDGRFCIATDLADKSLAAYPGARRSPRIALRVLRDIANGLAHAHTNRILHLDLKPDNIMIFPGGRAAIGDFGTSRLAQGATRTYTEAGTLGYIAPEQAYGRPRKASDVFSVGLIALEILTGKLPSWPFTWPPVDNGRFDQRVPKEFHSVLRKAAAFQPARRYPDGIALFRAMDRAYRTLEPRPEKKSRKRKRGNPEPRSPLTIEAEMFRRSHGAGLGMSFCCYHCQGPIAESMEHCPWCGKCDHSFAEVTPAPLICPECERGVRPEWTACPWCYPGRFAGNGKPVRPDPRAERGCSRRGCSGRLRKFMRYCPVCKQKPRRLWSDPELPDRCPRCRWPVSHQYWRHCPWCGRREPKAGTFIRPR